MARRGRPSPAVLPLLAWDVLWKALSIRRAVQLKKYRWIPILAATSSGGLLQMWFLYHHRDRGETHVSPETA